MSDRQAQIEAEAARRYPEHRGEFLTGMAFHAFQRGAEWADANPRPRTITRERVGAVAVKASDRFGGVVEPDAVRLLIGVALQELGVEVVGDE